MPELGPALLALARRAIASQFAAPAGETPLAKPDLPELTRPGASFVTLTREGRLRGCIGSLEAWRPLFEDVRANALAAAFRDPRFPPLSAAEWPAMRIEVSLLSPAVPLAFTDEADALAQLRPGIDGVVFSCGGRRSTFLPQVWEDLPEPAVFMARLKEKAGLPDAFWAPDVELRRYTVDKWKEAA